MTIQLLHAYNGASPGVYTYAAAEEARLIGLGLARAYVPGMDGQNPVFNTGEQLGIRGVVSADGNQPSATLAATVGTPGQVVKLSDGPDKGVTLVWAIPEGRTTYAWCWQIYPQASYL